MPQQEGYQAHRVFEQPADAISFYSDFAHVIATGSEVLLQLYETIPATPGPEGRVEMVRTRLRATVMVSTGQAITIGKLLLKAEQEEQRS